MPSSRGARMTPDFMTPARTTPGPVTPDPVTPSPAGRPALVARVALALGLVLLGLWTLHGFLPALAWAVILAIATWPLYRRARHRFPAHGHGILLPALFATAIALLFLLPLG